MFGKIFLIAFLLLISADIYIFAIFIRKLTKNTILRILWFLPSMFLLAGIYFFFLSGSKYDGREIFSIVYIAITLPKIIFTIISLFDFPLRFLFKWKIYPFTILGLMAALCMEYIIIYGSTVGKTKFEVNEIEFVSASVPDSFDGYKIVQISDLHIGNWGGNKKVIKNLVGIINKLHPDAIMVTGDLVHNRADELDGFEGILSEMKAKDGIFSVLGNHDYGPYYRWENKEKEIQNLRDLKQRQSNLGWTLLNNQHVFLVRDTDSIALIGVENDGAPPFPQYGDLRGAMKGTESTNFKLLLSHDPTHWRREVLDTDIDLMLAGHTHGTQFALGRLSFASLVYPEWSGMYEYDGQSLYVNVGIGHVGIPFRFGAWPEITLITLKKEK